MTDAKLLTSVEVERILREEMPVDWLKANLNKGINEFHFLDGVVPEEFDFTNGIMPSLYLSLGASYETDDEGERIIYINLFVYDQYLDVGGALYEKDGFKPPQEMLDQIAKEWNDAVSFYGGEKK